MMMMMMTDNNDPNNNHNSSVEQKKKKMQMKKMMKMKMKTSSSSRRPLREREQERGQLLLYPSSYALSKDLPLFTISESLLYRDSLLTKAAFDVITITADNNNNNNNNIRPQSRGHDTCKGSNIIISKLWYC